MRARVCLCMCVWLSLPARVSNECFYTALRGQNLIFTASAFAEHLNVNKKNRPCIGRVEAEILVTPRCVTCVYSFPSHGCKISMYFCWWLSFRSIAAANFQQHYKTYSWRYWSTQRTALNIGRKKRSQLWGSNLQLKFTSLLRVLPIVSSILRCDSHRFLKFYTATVMVIRRKRKHAQSNAMRHSHVFPRRVVDAALLSSSVLDCYGCAKDFDSLLLFDDDTKFEEILLGSHTHTHPRLHPPTSLGSTPSILSFHYFFFVVCYCCCWCCCCCCLLCCNLYRSFSMIFFL